MSFPPIFSNVRVLDLTRIVAGPWCTQTLADLGADVIKIERPGEGDDTRKVGPFITGADGKPTLDSAFYMGVNRGKRSVTIDIAATEGAAIVRELAERADVLVENYKVGGLKRYNLDYASLKEINPRLIYCSVTGFGQSGPYAQRPAYDSVLQAMCGLMSTCGQPDGEPGAGPMRAAVPIADIFTGLYATIAILAAVAQREQTGRGQYIDMAMVDVATAINAHLALGYLMTGIVPQRQGNNNPITAPSEVFRATDGYFSMSAGNAKQFNDMLSVLGLDPAIADDAKFATNVERIRNRTELHAILESRTLQQPVDYWIERLSAATVPCAPIYDMQQVFADPHIMSRDPVVKLEHASGAEVPTLRSPLRMSSYDVAYRAPPTLGQHSRDVICGDLGKSDGEFERLRLAGVV